VLRPTVIICDATDLAALRCAALRSRQCSAPLRAALEHRVVAQLGIALHCSALPGLLEFSAIDILHNTPVLDIKPCVRPWLLAAPALVRSAALARRLYAMLVGRHCRVRPVVRVACFAVGRSRPTRVCACDALAAKQAACDAA
jgi:hypothetical protein